MDNWDKLLNDYLFMKKILKEIIHMNNSGFDEIHIKYTPEVKEKLIKFLNRDDSEDENEFYKNNIHCIVTKIHYDLCSKFIEQCRKHPTTPWNEIPEAVEAMNESEEFDRICKKYFGIDFNRKEK